MHASIWFALRVLRHVTPILVLSQVKLEFPAPEEPGSYAYTLYFMSDSYLGCDQVYDFEVTVAEGDGDVDTGVAAADE